MIMGPFSCNFDLFMMITRVFVVVPFWMITTFTEIEVKRDRKVNFFVHKRPLYKDDNGEEVP